MGMMIRVGSNLAKDSRICVLYLKNIRNNFCQSIYEVKMAEQYKPLDSSSSSCERAWVQILFLTNSVVSYMHDQGTTLTSTDPFRNL